METKREEIELPKISYKSTYHDSSAENWSCDLPRVWLPYILDLGPAVEKSQNPQTQTLMTSQKAVVRRGSSMVVPYCRGVWHWNLANQLSWTDSMKLNFRHSADAANARSDDTSCCVLFLMRLRWRKAPIWIILKTLIREITSGMLWGLVQLTKIGNCRQRCEGFSSRH